MMIRKRLKKLGSKFTLLFVLLALVLCVGLCAFSGYISWREYTGFYWEKALDAARLAASYVDGNVIGGYLQTGETDEYYAQLQKTLQAIKREQHIKYLYVFVPAEDHFTYVMDVPLEQDDPEMLSALGDTYDYTELEYTYLLPDVQAKRACSQKIVVLENVYGPGVSAWAPVFNSEGDVVAMVEADMALDVVVESLTDFLRAAIFVCCALVLAVVVALALIMRRMVSRPLAKLTQNALEFASGESLSYPTGDITTGDEMQTLSEAFGKMAKDIDQYTQNLASVAADKERISTELSLATDIQISLLPRDFPAFPNRDEFDVYAMMHPAKVVGGDFYDFFLIDQDHLCVAVGGVSGRGIPAALFMVVAKTIIKNQMMTGMPVDEAMSVINTRLFESSTSSMEVRAFVGVLSIKDGGFAYVNAGQSEPLLMRKEGSFEPLAGQKMSPLAQTENIRYRKIDVQLRQGDKLLLYSAGAAMAKNTDGQPFGADRLRQSLNGRRLKLVELKPLIDTMYDEICAFEDGAQREDDVTMLGLTYHKGDRARAEIAVRAREDGFPQVQRFLKRQLEENGLGGALYARMAVAVEEAFTLAAGQAGSHSQIVLRCAVEEQNGKKGITVTLLYEGPQLNPFLHANDAQQDAAGFIRRSMDVVNYAYQDGRNVLELQKLV